MRAPRVPVLAALALALSAIPGHADLIATEPAPTPISAFRGQALWSSAVSTNGNRRYRLRLWANGVARLLPVRSRTIPFDAQLGRDRSGHPVIVYSRCEAEP